MEREQIIDHLADVVAAVFQAEDSIQEEWKGRLQATRNADDQTKYRTWREYLHAIAEKMASGTKEAELLKLYTE